MLPQSNRINSRNMETIFFFLLLKVVCVVIVTRLFAKIKLLYKLLYILYKVKKNKICLHNIVRIWPHVQENFMTK